MKQHEYIEGPKARENFERGMIALFKVPKAIGVPFWALVPWLFEECAPSPSLWRYNLLRTG
jgi:hypothetical protein